MGPSPRSQRTRSSAALTRWTRRGVCALRPAWGGSACHSLGVHLSLPPPRCPSAPGRVLQAVFRLGDPVFPACPPPPPPIRAEEAGQSAVSLLAESFRPRGLQLAPVARAYATWRGQRCRELLRRLGPGGPGTRRPCQLAAQRQLLPRPRETEAGPPPGKAASAARSDSLFRPMASVLSTGRGAGAAPPGACPPSPGALVPGVWPRTRRGPRGAGGPPFCASQDGARETLASLLVKPGIFNYFLAFLCSPLTPAGSTEGLSWTQSVTVRRTVQRCL